jgi:hypothetical protein
MKTLPESVKIVVLAAVGIGAALTIVTFAQNTPAPGSYVLLLKDNVPVANKAQFEAALKKNSKDKMKWKDEQEKVTDVPTVSNAPRPEDIQTAQVKTFDAATRARLTTIGAHVTVQASFNTAAGLKAVVDTLQ